MTGQTQVRAAGPVHRGAIEAIYSVAFPDEDLLPLLRALLDGRAPVLSLVAVCGGTVVGHCLFTHCAAGGRPVALFGPLAVAPARRGEGHGSALVREGLARLTTAGAVRVCVLGDPTYYGRFGFVVERWIATPCPIPDDWRPAWRSLALARGSAPGGTLEVPAPWCDPALWSP